MDIRVDPVAFDVAATRLDGTLMRPAEPLPAILFVHGWGGSQAEDLRRAREAAALGAICLTFDLRGHAATSPEYRSVSRADSLADLCAAYDWLLQRPGVDAEAVAVVGVSYGGYLATILSTLRPVRWLALRSPALYKDPGWELPKLELNRDPDLAAYRRRRIEWNENRAFRAARAFRGDVLIVEAENDSVVPHAVTENYVAAFGNVSSLTTRRIGGADHAFADKAAQDDYTAALLKWLTEMIIGGRKAVAKQRLDVHERVRRDAAA